MRATFLVFKPGLSKPEILPIDGPPALGVLKAGIGGGHLEVVPFFTRIEHGGQMHDCITFCDEEGKLKGLKYNREATFRWDRSMRVVAGCGCSPDHLVGPILVVIGDAEFMEAL
jgi:hypothetical protein